MINNDHTWVNNNNDMCSHIQEKHTYMLFFSFEKDDFPRMNIVLIVTSVQIKISLLYMISV